MRYKAGDIVRIKNRTWYEQSKNEKGEVELPSSRVLTKEMSAFCGRKAVVIFVGDGYYWLSVDEWKGRWSDEMLE